MEKIKNVLIVIIGIVCFAGIIGLLMAFDDGLLDGTVIAKIISVVFPALIGAYITALIVAYWWNAIIRKTAHVGKVFLTAFIGLAISIIFFSKDILFIIAMVIVALTVITLIFFWLKN